MRRIGVLTALAVSALALSACESGRLRAPDLRLPAAFEAPAGAVDPQKSAAALDHWWILFGDAQLQQLVEQALVSAPDARTAMARLDEAAATRRERIDAVLPQGNLQGTATDQHTHIDGSPFGAATGGGAAGGFGGISIGGETKTESANFNVSWEADLYGKSRAALRGASADFAATRFDVEASRMSLAAQVAQDLFDARALAVQLADARETVRIRQDTARVGGIRADRGLGSRADAARFQSDLDTSQAEVVRLEAALAASKRTLLVLLGRGADPLESLAIEARADAPPTLPPTTPGELLARRPDVREAEARVRVEAATVVVDRLSLFPKFTLQPGASISKSTGATVDTVSVWSLGLGAMLPILDRPKLLAELHAEKARGEQAVIAYEHTVQRAYGEAENALTAVQADQTRTVALASAETEARYAYDAADRGFKAGLTDMTTLLDSERAWLAARGSLTAARAQSSQDTVAAFKALGGGWTLPPLQQTASVASPATTESR